MVHHLTYGLSFVQLFPLDATNEVDLTLPMGRMIRVPLSSEDTLALEKFLGKKCDDATRSATKTELNTATGITATVVGAAAVSYSMDVDFSSMPSPTNGLEFQSDVYGGGLNGGLGFGGTRFWGDFWNADGMNDGMNAGMDGETFADSMFGDGFGDSVSDSSFMSGGDSGGGWGGDSGGGWGGDSGGGGDYGGGGGDSGGGYGGGDD